MGKAKRSRRSVDPIVASSADYLSPPSLDEKDQNRTNTRSEEEIRDWSNLTEPLLFSILRRLESMEDFFSFRGVCRSWRLLAAFTPDALASQAPLLLRTLFRSSVESFFDIYRRRFYKNSLPWFHPDRFTLSYSHGFLVTSTLPLLSSKLKLLLRNIFTGEHIRLPKTPGVFTRVIFSAPPSSLGCLVVLFCHGPSCNIQFCRLGDSLWKVHCLGGNYYVEDMLFFLGSLYALIGSTHLVLVDLSSPHPELTTVGVHDVLSKEKKMKVYKHFLAQSGNDLLLVCVDSYFEIEVYRWDFQIRRWVEITSLGGRALFIAHKGFVASVAPIEPVIRANCVYYSSYDEPHMTERWYEFSLEDKVLKNFYADGSNGYSINGLIDSRLYDSWPAIWVLPSMC